MNRRDVLRGALALGAAAVASGPAEFAALITAETERWKTVVDRAGIKLD